MATSQSTIDYLLDQLKSAGSVSARKMFGEYALYCDEKLVALVCDGQLFVKITDSGRHLAGDNYEEAPAYPGAKPSMRITADRFDDREFLCALVRSTADALPKAKPKPKKRRVPKPAMKAAGKKKPPKKKR